MRARASSHHCGGLRIGPWTSWRISGNWQSRRAQVLTERKKLQHFLISTDGRDRLPVCGLIAHRLSYAVDHGSNRSHQQSRSK